MLHDSQVEELIHLVTGLDRTDLIRQMRQHPATFPVDFTHEFLEAVPLERLKHIFVALCLQTQRLPPELAESAVPQSIISCAAREDFMPLSRASGRRRIAPLTGQHADV